MHILKSIKVYPSRQLCVKKINLLFLHYLLTLVNYFKFRLKDISNTPRTTGAFFITLSTLYCSQTAFKSGFWAESATAYLRCSPASELWWSL